MASSEETPRKRKAEFDRLEQIARKRKFYLRRIFKSMTGPMTGPELEDLCQFMGEVIGATEKLGDKNHCQSVVTGYCCPQQALCVLCSGDSPGIKAEFLLTSDDHALIEQAQQVLNAQKAAQERHEAAQTAARERHEAAQKAARERHEAAQKAARERHKAEQLTISLIRRHITTPYMFKKPTNDDLKEWIEAGDRVLQAQAETDKPPHVFYSEVRRNSPKEVLEGILKRCALALGVTQTCGATNSDDDDTKSGDTEPGDTESDDEANSSECNGNLI